VIASLTGTVQSLAASHAVLDVSGVGYLVFITPQTSRDLHLGDSVLLHTALIVREDAFTLFGFATTEELEMFDLLRSVTGVGPKSALAILGQLGSDQVRTAVLSENDAAFKAVSGIGPKTAKLITVTLAGKITGMPASATGKSATSAPKVDLANVIAALQGLGWNERAAAEAVREVAESVGTNAAADVILKAALARLGSSKSISGGDQ
jgi:Holliday junction DNA helicase RuvA